MIAHVVQDCHSHIRPKIGFYFIEETKAWQEVAGICRRPRKHSGTIFSALEHARESYEGIGPHRSSHAISI
jgi:hypothetical protein